MGYTSHSVLHGVDPKGKSLKLVDGLTDSADELTDFGKSERSDARKQEQCRESCQRHKLLKFSYLEVHRQNDDISAKIKGFQELQGVGGDMKIDWFSSSSNMLLMGFIRALN